MSTKQKPFDLEAALRGEPVETRDGREVTQITNFDVRTKYSVVAVIDGAIGKFTADGKYYLSEDSNNDLFMATQTVKKEGWVNLYKSDDEILTARTSNAYACENDAKRFMEHGYITTVKIEWEEEI